MIVEGFEISTTSEPLVEQVLLYLDMTNLRQIMDEFCYKALELLSQNEEGTDIEEYRTWVGRLTSIESRYLLAESYMDTKEFSQAHAILDEIPETFEGEDFNEESYSEYLEYFSTAQAYYQLEAGEEIPSSIMESLVELSEHTTRTGIKSHALLEIVTANAAMRELNSAIVRPPSGIDNCVVQINTPHKNVSEEKNHPVEEKINTEKNIQVTVFPNPAKNTMYIALDKMPQSQVEYNLYDIQGKQLQSGRFEGQRQEVNISTLASGIYFISVNVEHTKTTKKIVIE